MAKNLKVHFSSKNDSWETPQDLFNEINKTYGPFQLDPASSDTNTKCPIWFTEDQDGLKQDWHVFGKVFCNPPYSNVGDWLKKGYEESQKGCRVVMLVPARTDTKAFHNYAMKAARIHLIKGRLKFSGSKNSAPFPSMIVVFEQGNYLPMVLSWNK